MATIKLLIYGTVGRMGKYSFRKGFTIVELLIVIVVIAILAAISIVAYNGIQQRARDAERSQELSQLQKALEVYHADMGGYPKCGAVPATTGPNTPPALSSGTATSCLTDELVPSYLNAIPVDPTNTGSFVYRYAPGYTKTGATTYSSSPVADNYILGTKQETVSSPTYSGWGFSDLTLLLGSSN
jgi:prepilin-type N-terminal cleavage/methylation domain-containing protein